METPTAESIWRPEIVPGQRIFLSHPRREDVPLYARWFADLELTTYIGAQGMSFMPEHEQEWYDGLVRDKDRKMFAIVVREGQRMIGNVDFHAVDYRRGVTELGIAIGDKSAWGQGYGSEAVRLMCDYGFTFLGLHTIYLWHVAFNERAPRLPEGRLQGGRAAARRRRVRRPALRPGADGHHPRGLRTIRAAPHDWPTIEQFSVLSFERRVTP